MPDDITNSDTAPQRPPSRFFTAGQREVERRAAEAAERKAERSAVDTAKRQAVNPDEDRRAAIAASLDAERLTAEAEHLAAEAARLADAAAKGEFPLTRCPNCEVDVRPEGKGRCPRCKRMLKFNTYPRKHPVNVTRREQLHAENIAEYQPDTLHLHRACRWLANVTERLENVKHGTPEHQRLVGMYSELTTTLEAARAQRESHTRTDIDTLDIDALVDLAERLLIESQRQRNAQRKDGAA